MIQFISDSKELFSLGAAVLGILLSLAFGGVLSWRQRVCLDYASSMNVAVNILRDRFVQRTSSHYSDVADERKKQKTAVEDIYKRPEQQQLIRELGRDLEDQNRVKRLFGWLVVASQASFGFLWGSIVVVVVGIVFLWAEPSFFVWVTWAVVLGVFMVGFGTAITLMWALDGKFFKLVHRIIQSEGE